MHLTVKHIKIGKRSTNKLSKILLRKRSKSKSRRKRLKRRRKRLKRQKKRVEKQTKKVRITGKCSEIVLGRSRET